MNVTTITRFLDGLGEATYKRSILLAEVSRLACAI